MELSCMPHLILIVLLCIVHVSGMRFDMDDSDTKCFMEEMTAKALVLGSYRVVSENAPRMSVKVSSPYGNPVHFHEHVSEGEFGFTADEAGNYMACFWIPEAARGSKISVELDWKTGVAAKDWASIAKRESIDDIELELRKLEDSVQAIHDAMLHLRQREEEMRNVSEMTNTRMAWFSISSLFISLVVAGLQLWHLKTFFERKKLL